MLNNICSNHTFRKSGHSGIFNESHLNKVAARIKKCINFKVKFLNFQSIFKKAEAAA